MRGFSDQFEDIDLPNNTLHVETLEFIGKLNSNGNGTDFAVLYLLESELTLQELKNYYASVKFKPAKRSSDSPVSVSVEVLEKNIIETEAVEHRHVEFKTHLDVNREYYYLMIFDGGYWALFDPASN